MAALDLVIDGLAEVVQKAGPLDGNGVEPELGGHDRGQIGHFERMVQHVLAERGAIAQTSQGVDELRVKIVDARIERGLGSPASCTRWFTSLTALSYISSMRAGWMRRRR